MINAIKKFTSSKVFKPLLLGITGLFTKNANKAAKAYADKAVSEVADAIPETLEAAAKAYAAYQLSGFGASNVTAIVDIVSDQKASKEKKALLSPLKMLHNINNYNFLAGVEDGGYMQHEEDDFVVITKPSLK